jgi:hypothetical protein
VRVPPDPLQGEPLLPEPDDAARETLGRVVAGLREQAHEHGNRLHGVAGLLALDDVAAARRALEEQAREQHERFEAITSRVAVPELVGVLVATSVVAARRGIRVTLEDAVALDALPDGLDALAVATVLGRLVDDACAAVASLAEDRRWVRVGVAVADDAVRLVVVDGRLPDPALRRRWTTDRRRRGRGATVRVQHDVEPSATTTTALVRR